MEKAVAPLVGYVRVSAVRGRGDERFKSPDLQREAMTRWADNRFGRNGYEWLDWFTDLDRSGVSLDRPELNKARLCAIESAARIVVYDIARWARNVPEGTDALARLREDDVEVVSASEDFASDTPEGDLTLHMFLALSQYYAQVQGRRWRETIASNRAAGLWHGVPPFDYRRLTEVEAKKHGRSSGVIVPDPIKAAHVRELFDRYHAGEALYALGREGVERGWFSRAMTVKSILGNPAYAGLIPVDGEYKVRRARDRRILKDNHGRPLRERTHARFVRGMHEPIVTTREVVLARRRLQRDARPSPGVRPGARWSAAGLTRCGTCRRKLTFNDKSATAADGRYLICPNRRCEGRPGSVRVDALERHVNGLVVELAQRLRSNVVQRMAEQTAARASTALDRGTLLAEQAKLRAAIKRGAAELLLATPEGDGLAPEDVESAIGSFRLRLREVDRMLADLVEQRVPDDLVSVADKSENLAQLWPRMSLGERADALGALGVEVLVSRSRRYRDDLDGRIHFEVPWLPPSTVRGPSGG